MIDSFPDVTSMARAVRSGEVSSLELVEEALERADALDAVLGTFISRFDAQAKRDAARIDQARKAGEDLGPLAGVPLGIKDFIATREAPSTGQSLVFDPSWWASRDAPAVNRLRSAGGIILGKTTMAEHAAGRPDPAGPFPIPRNPWDPRRWTGGSSAGTGNGIAAGIFPGGLGTDTAGSVRIPAAMCGITGFKPTRGLISLEGCLPASPSLDVIGPMARTAQDCAALMSLMAPEAMRDTSPARSLRDIRIGVPWELVTNPARGVQAECLDSFEQAVTVLREGGATIVKVEVPDFDAVSAATMLVMIRELFETHRSNLPNRWEDYGRSIRRLAFSGSFVPVAVYEQARRFLCRARASLTARMSDVHALALPAWGTAAPLYQGNGGVPAKETNFTIAWNGLGAPALALPMGFDAGGLPLSLQLIGSPGSDGRTLGIGILYQLETGWHELSPTVDGRAVPAPVPDLDPPYWTGADPADVCAQLSELPRGITDSDLLAIAGLHANLKAAAAAVCSDN